MVEFRFYRIVGMLLIGASITQWDIGTPRNAGVLFVGGLVIWACGVPKSQWKSWIA
jgi:hypothetical protein